jgi:hypothetical protein
MAAELERSKASVARLLKERDDLDEKLRAVGKELKQAINEKSVQVRCLCEEPCSVPWWWLWSVERLRGMYVLLIAPCAICVVLGRK